MVKGGACDFREMNGGGYGNCFVKERFRSSK